MSKRVLQATILSSPSLFREKYDLTGAVRSEPGLVLSNVATLLAQAKLLRRAQQRCGNSLAMADHALDVWTSVVSLGCIHNVLIGINPAVATVAFIGWTFREVMNETRSKVARNAMVQNNDGSVISNQIVSQVEALET